MYKQFLAPNLKKNRAILYRYIIEPEVKQNAHAVIFDHIIFFLYQNEGFKTD